jgi:hypothetical protein
LRIKNLVVVVVAEPRLHTTFKSAVEALLVLFKLAHTNIKVLKWAVDEITNKDVWSFFLSPPQTVAAKKKSEK